MPSYTWMLDFVVKAKLGEYFSFGLVVILLILSTKQAHRSQLTPDKIMYANTHAASANASRSGTC